MTLSPKLLTTLLLSLTLAACNKYSITLNEGAIYTPAPLFKEYLMADKNLQDCVLQTVLDQNITAAAELTRLSCSSAGIKTLAGIETFKALKALNLHNNALTEIKEVAALSQLAVLNISRNQLTNIDPLLDLLHLTRVDLSSNDTLECAGIARLAAQLNHSLERPKQCTSLK